MTAVKSQRIRQQIATYFRTAPLYRVEDTTKNDGLPVMQYPVRVRRVLRMMARMARRELTRRTTSATGGR